MISNRPLFAAGEFIAQQLDEADIPALQAFFAANPEYFLTVNGGPPRADEAQQEFTDLPPPEMRFGQRYMIGFVDASGGLVGMASVLSDFLAYGVWHIGLFIAASSLHGRGKAQAMYAGLQAWMRGNGAQWVRLGAVVGNKKAERFWEKVGYREVRLRVDVPTGQLISTIRVMVKALAADNGGMDEYLRRVERDRPDSSLR